MPPFLWGCVCLIDPDTRRQRIVDIATDAGWQYQVVKGARFDLATFTPKAMGRQNHLVVYIEGDGKAWVTTHQPSLNPTPEQALALRLALKHPGNNAVYLARPCQYVVDQQRHYCDESVWTQSRFSDDVIQASSDAISVLKKKFNARSLTLIGYSGGGAVAALVAARRNDVELLVTVAGVLDHRLWTAQHNISPLADSLNPADYRQQLMKVPQYHLSGGSDDVVPSVQAKDFVNGFQSTGSIIFKIIEHNNHVCCWVEQWPQLLLK